MEKFIRSFADFAGGLFMQVYTDGSTGKSIPFWVAVSISIIGLAAFGLLLIAGYSLLFGR